MIQGNGRAGHLSDPFSRSLSLAGACRAGARRRAWRSHGTRLCGTYAFHPCTSLPEARGTGIEVCCDGYADALARLADADAHGTYGDPDGNSGADGHATAHSNRYANAADSDGYSRRVSCAHRYTRVAVADGYTRCVLDRHVRADFIFSHGICSVSEASFQLDSTSKETLEVFQIGVTL